MQGNCIHSQIWVAAGSFVATQQFGVLHFCWGTIKAANRSECDLSRPPQRLWCKHWTREYSINFYCYLVNTFLIPCSINNLQNWHRRAITKSFICSTHSSNTGNCEIRRYFLFIFIFFLVKMIKGFRLSCVYNIYGLHFTCFSILFGLDDTFPS